ncbi:hypothetical protein HC256_004735 [Beauveria bassiana]|nr:hypothetical protein HC256_004735 [Beauveria bassiana]
MSISGGVIVGCAETLHSFSSHRISLVVLFSELCKRDFLGVLLLSLELSNECHLLINLDQKVLDMAVDVEDISGHFRLDILGSVRVTECVLSLIEMGARRRNANNHDCFAVATKRKFQQSRELAVAIWDHEIEKKWRWLVSVILCDIRFPEQSYP